MLRAGTSRIFFQSGISNYSQSLQSVINHPMDHHPKKGGQQQISQTINKNNWDRKGWLAFQTARFMMIHEQLSRFHIPANLPYFAELASEDAPFRV